MKNKSKTSMGDEEISSIGSVGEVNGCRGMRLMVAVQVVEPEVTGARGACSKRWTGPELRSPSSSSSTL